MAIKITAYTYVLAPLMEQDLDKVLEEHIQDLLMIRDVPG